MGDQIRETRTRRQLSILRAALRVDEGDDIDRLPVTSSKLDACEGERRWFHC
jgi:hypothetical protein